MIHENDSWFMLAMGLCFFVFARSYGRALAGKLEGFNTPGRSCLRSEMAYTDGASLRRGTDRDFWLEPVWPVTVVRLDRLYLILNSHSFLSRGEYQRARFAAVIPPFGPFALKPRYDNPRGRRSRLYVRIEQQG
jgi:hypothetical protein